MGLPKLALRLGLGTMAELATHGQRVIPMRAKELGFEFRFPLLDPALREVLRGNHETHETHEKEKRITET